MIIQKNNMQYKGVTKRTKDLLANEENYSVDFKLKSTQVDPDDFVSFANSKDGGTILFGVKEINIRGLQKGQIVGYEVGDKHKQIILNKALSCSPAIEIFIYVENYKTNPIFRVEIPSGKKKPYSTNSGKYLIRENGRNRALHPVDLLKIFVENETGEFLQRFNSVTKDINTRLEILDRNFLEKMVETTKTIVHNTERNLHEVMTSLGDVNSDIDRMSYNINQSLQDIFESASNAESLSDDAMAYSDETNNLTQDISEKVDNIEQDIMEIESRIKLLLNHFNIEDPLMTRQKYFLKETIKSIGELNVFMNDQVIDLYGQECFELAKKEIDDGKV